MSSLPTTTTAHVPTVPRPDAVSARPAFAPPAGLNVRQILAMMLRHIWLILIVFLVVAVLGVGSFAVCNKFFQSYTARGMMQLNEQPRPGDATWRPQLTDQFVVRSRQNTEISRIMAEANLDDMLKQNTAKQQRWYRQHENLGRPMTELLREQLNASAVRDATLIEISITTPDATAGAEMVNYIMQYNEDKSKARASASMQEQIDVLKQQVGAKEREIEDLNRDLEKARQSEDYQALERQQSEVQQRVTQLSTDCTRQELQVDVAKRMRDARLPLQTPRIVLPKPGDPAPQPGAWDLLTEKGLNDYKEWVRTDRHQPVAEAVLKGNPDKFRDIDAVYSDPTFKNYIESWYREVEMTIGLLREVQRDPNLANLVSRKQFYEENRGRLLSVFDKNHPEVIQSEAQIRECDDAIRTKTAELLTAARERAFRDADAELIAAQELLETIKAKLKEALENKRKTEEKWAQYQSLVSRQAKLEREKDELARKRDDTDMIRAMNTPAISKVSSAAAPQRPSFPRWDVFLAVWTLAFLVIAIGLVLIVELADSSVRTTRDISDQVRLPLLGVIPHVESGTMSRQEMARLVVRDPMSLLAESFRQVRTNLLFSTPVDQLGSIAVTSAARDEGKTTVAANLAVTVALSGRRVLLVDANFRRPALDMVFSLTSAVGLSNVLTNQATLAEAAQTTDVPNLSVIVAGPTPPNPAELLGSATMRAFLDQADADYDIVIFDTPPALLITDARTMATMVDGVVAVVRATATSRGMVARLRDELHRVHARIIGAVLNDARPTRGGYFRQSQQQYEEYHSQLNGG